MLPSESESDTRPAKGFPLTAFVFGAALGRLVGDLDGVVVFLGRPGPRDAVGPVATVEGLAYNVACLLGLPGPRLTTTTSTVDPKSNSKACLSLWADTCGVGDVEPLFDGDLDFLLPAAAFFVGLPLTAFEAGFALTLDAEDTTFHAFPFLLVETASDFSESELRMPEKSNSSPESDRLLRGLSLPDLGGLPLRFGAGVTLTLLVPCALGGLPLGLVVGVAVS